MKYSSRITVIRRFELIMTLGEPTKIEKRKTKKIKQLYHLLLLNNNYHLLLLVKADHSKLIKIHTYIIII